MSNANDCQAVKHVLEVANTVKDKSDSISFWCSANLGLCPLASPTIIWNQEKSNKNNLKRQPRDAIFQLEIHKRVCGRDCPRNRLGGGLTALPRRFSCINKEPQTEVEQSPCKSVTTGQCDRVATVSGE